MSSTPSLKTSPLGRSLSNLGRWKTVSFQSCVQPQSVFHLFPQCRWIARVCLYFFSFSLLGPNDPFEPADTYAVLWHISILVSGCLCFPSLSLFGFQWSASSRYKRFYDAHLKRDMSSCVCHMHRSPTLPPHPPLIIHICTLTCVLLAERHYFPSTRHWSPAKPHA